MADENSEIFGKELQLMEHIVKTITGNPRCYKAYCNGKGYTSIITYIGEDKKPHLRVMLCQCGEVGKSEYALLEEKILEQSQKTSNALLSLAGAMDQSILKHSETLSTQIDEMQNAILRNQILEITARSINYLHLRWMKIILAVAIKIGIFKRIEASDKKGI